MGRLVHRYCEGCSTDACIDGLCLSWLALLTPGSLDPTADLTRYCAAGS